METVSLREAVDPETRGNLTRFAEKVGVTWPTAWRWTLPSGHPKKNLPLPKYWKAIEAATDGRWRSPSTSFDNEAAAPTSAEVSG